MPSTGATNRLGSFKVACYPPVDRIDFSEFPELDVVGFDIHVDDLFAVGKGDGIAEFVEDFEVFFDRVGSDLLFPGSPQDVFHGVEIDTVLGSSKFVDWGNVGVFK